MHGYFPKFYVDEDKKKEDGELAHSVPVLSYETETKIEVHLYSDNDEAYTKFLKAGDCINISQMDFKSIFVVQTNLESRIINQIIDDDPYEYSKVYDESNDLGSVLFDKNKSKDRSADPYKRHKTAVKFFSTQPPVDSREYSKDSNSKQGMNTSRENLYGQSPSKDSVPAHEDPQEHFFD